MRQRIGWVVVNRMTGEVKKTGSGYSFTGKVYRRPHTAKAQAKPPETWRVVEAYIDIED